MKPIKYSSLQSFVSESPQWLKDHLNFISEWNGSDEHISVTTSGSTGDPKSIFMRKETMRASARLTAGYFGLRQNCDVLLALPSSYIAGKMVIVRALTNGWNLWFTEPSSNPLKDIEQQFEFASFTPMQMEGILDNNPAKLTLVNTILVGGAEVRPTLAARIKAIHGRCYETYGMTETVSHVAVRNIGDENKTFEALPGVEFLVDQKSCLVIHADHLGKEHVITNDLVELIDSRHFHLLGRADDVINSGAVKLFPSSIEAKIENLVKSNYYITSKRDEVLGNAVVLLIEGTASSDELHQMLTEQLRKSLDSYEFPREIKYVPLFERTSAGKIKRVYL